MVSRLKKIGFKELTYDTGEVVLNYAVGPDNGIPLVLFQKIHRSLVVNGPGCGMTVIFIRFLNGQLIFWDRINIILQIFFRQ